MIAQEDCPLAILGDRRRLFEDIDDRMTILHMERHKHSRHEREMETHVAFVSGAEVGYGVVGPLICFGKQHAVGILRINAATKFLEYPVGLYQIFATCPLPLYQIRHSVETKTVDAEVEP